MGLRGTVPPPQRHPAAYISNGAGAVLGPSIHGSNAGMRRAVDPLRLAAERSARAADAQSAEARQRAETARHAANEQFTARRLAAHGQELGKRAAAKRACEDVEDFLWNEYVDAKFTEELESWRINTLVEQDEERFAAAERARISQPLGVKPYNAVDSPVRGPPGSDFTATNAEEAFEAMNQTLDGMETRERDLHRIIEHTIDLQKDPTLFGIPPLKESVSRRHLESIRPAIQCINEFSQEALAAHAAYNSRPYLGRELVAESEMNQELYERAVLVGDTAQAIDAAMHHKFAKADRAARFAAQRPIDRLDGAHASVHPFYRA